MQLAPQDNQLMSKHRVLSFKPQLRLEWRGQDGQNETEQPDHSASLGDSITSSTQIRFSVHTRVADAHRGERRRARHAADGADRPRRHDLHRSHEGRSHTPEAFSTVDDMVAGIKVLAAGLHALAY